MVFFSIIANLGRSFDNVNLSKLIKADNKKMYLCEETGVSTLFELG